MNRDIRILSCLNNKTAALGAVVFIKIRLVLLNGIKVGIEKNGLDKNSEIVKHITVRLMRRE